MNESENNGYVRAFDGPGWVIGNDSFEMTISLNDNGLPVISRLTDTALPDLDRSGGSVIGPVTNGDSGVGSLPSVVKRICASEVTLRAPTRVLITKGPPGGEKAGGKRPGAHEGSGCRIRIAHGVAGGTSRRVMYPPGRC